MANQPKSKLRKEQILRAAEKVFARKGFQEATISDVAREAKVSEATIYEYFPSKEELLFSIPGETTRRSKESMTFLLQFLRGASNKLRAIIYHYLWFYETNPDYAAVAMLILKQNRKFLEVGAYEDVRELSRILLNIVKEGIDSGEFRADINLNLVRAIILGTVEHLVIRRVLLGKPESLVELSDSLTDLIIGGIKIRREEKVWNIQIRQEPEENTPPTELPSMKKRKPLGDPSHK
ncbi:MAG: TetR/AcrR family transcriptional regulator [Deltaproteobacteria bacterium]|nr:TetR/AcrR family transcriptional regulator [Deltaproteobacteria bacterium]